MTAKNAKYGFGYLIDLARIELVTAFAVVVMPIEELKRLKVGGLRRHGTSSRAGGSCRLCRG